MVSAMLCRKATVAISCSGIADCFPCGADSARGPAGDVGGWVQALGAKVNNSDRVRKCASMGQDFAHLYCSNHAARKSPIEVFRKAGVSIAM